MPRKTPNSSGPSRTLSSSQVKRKAEIDAVVASSAKRLKVNITESKSVAVEQFQSLIRERKEEKKAEAVRKQNQDFKRIAMRKFGNQKMNPLGIFPEKVWIHILSQLDDPKDLENVWEIHPFFRNILKETRNQDILLPQVLPLVSLFPHKELLTTVKVLRTVTKGLRNAVDRWFETNLIHSTQGKGSNTLKEPPSYRINLLKDEEAINGMLGDFCVGPVDSRAKRFFLRSFYLYVETEDISPSTVKNITIIEDKIICLLQTIGDQIWYFSVHFDGIRNDEHMGVSVSQFYILAVRLIHLMPNLKWIKMKFDFGAGDLVNQHSIFKYHPFPFLPCLQRLYFHVEEGSLKKFEILESILRSNPHIKTLNLEIEEERFNGEDPVFFRLLFVCMRSLSMNLENFSIEPWVYVAELQPMIRFAWCLKSLRLTIFTGESDSIGTLGNLFLLMNNFPSLQNVDINTNEDADDIRLGVIPVLVLPNLTSFGLIICVRKANYSLPENLQFFYSLQFLIHSKKLKHLVWDCSISEKESKLCGFLKDHKYEGGTIDFRGGLRDLKGSSIWKIFPDLEYVDAVTRFWKSAPAKARQKLGICFHQYYERNQFYRSKLTYKFGEIKRYNPSQFRE